MAHRVISRRRSNSVAFGAKQTSTILDALQSQIGARSIVDADARAVRVAE
jgi:hypothetical protein